MFDDIIKNKADEHEAPVPPDAWDNIVKKKKKKRFIFWWWSSSMILLLAALFTAGYFISRNKTQDSSTSVAANSTHKPVDKNNNTIVKEGASATTEQTQIRAENKKENNTPVIDNSKVTTSITAPAAGEKVNGNAIAAHKEIDENSKTIIASHKPVRKRTSGNVRSKQTDPGVDEMNGDEEKESINDENNIAGNKLATQITTAAPTEQPAGNVVPTDKETVAVTELKDTLSKQETKKENKSVAKQTGKHHWFIDAGIAPLLISSNYNENIVFNRTVSSNNNLTVYNAGLVKTSIEPAIAFSLTVRRELNKKFTIGTGLQYLLLKENISMEGKETNTAYTVVERLVNGTSGPELITDTIETVTEGTRNINAVNSYHLYSIPVFVQYNIIQKPTWSLGAAGGLYINISSSYQNEIDRNATALLLVTPATENKTNTGMDIFAGIRIGKTLGKRVEFFAMPSMRRNLIKYNIENSLLNKNINQAGVQFGMSYRIN